MRMYSFNFGSSFLQMECQIIYPMIAKSVIMQLCYWFLYYRMTFDENLNVIKQLEMQRYGISQNRSHKHINELIYNFGNLQIAVK